MIDNRNRPHFLNFDESLSDDGRKLVEFIESQFVEADRTNNIEALNNLSGMIGHYYVNVFKLKSMTAERWVKDYPNAAHNAWAAKEYHEAKAQESQTVAETAATTNTLVDELNKFKESVTAEMQALREEIAKRDEEIATLKAAKPAKKAAKTDDAAPDKGEEPEA